MRDVHHCSGPRLRNDLYCVEWDVKLYYTIPYHDNDTHLTAICQDSLGKPVPECLCSRSYWMMELATTGAVIGANRLQSNVTANKPTHSFLRLYALPVAQLTVSEN